MVHIVLFIYICLIHLHKNIYNKTAHIKDMKNVNDQSHLLYKRQIKLEPFRGAYVH